MQPSFIQLATFSRRTPLCTWARGRGSVGEWKPRRVIGWMPQRCSFRRKSGTSKFGGGLASFKLGENRAKSPPRFAIHIGFILFTWSYNRSLYVNAVVGIERHYRATAWAAAGSKARWLCPRVRLVWAQPTDYIVTSWIFIVITIFKWI